MTALSDRTKYSMKNATIAMVTKIIAIVFGFFARMIFTRTLSMTYVGVNGLFTNILGALNVADLGIGTALVYSIYQPVACGNIEKQRALMKLFRRIYGVTACVVLVLGAAMFPILYSINTEISAIHGVGLIYLIFLIRTVGSYFLMHWSMIFLAYQRNYVNDFYDSLFLVLQNTIQSILLLTTHNYYLYLFVYVLSMICRNITICIRAKKEYPEVFEGPAGQISKPEKQEVYRNMRAILMHKVGTVVINNIDNLTLTAIVGITAVGMYSNYYLIIGSIRQVIDRIINGIAGSVGNLGATEDRGHVHDVFLAAFLIVAVGYGTAAIILYGILDVFVAASFGEAYVFPKQVVIVLCLNLFLNGIRQASLIFRDSLGLFWNDRYKTMAESLVNLISSIILAKQFGTVGVFIGTTVSIVGISMWVEPIVLYRDFFHVPVKEYFVKLLRYGIRFLAAWAVCAWLIQIIPWSGDVIRYLGTIVLCALIPPVFITGLQFSGTEMQYVLRHLKQMPGRAHHG